MARNNGTNPRLTSYIESLLRPSVVLIVVNEKESQTGFFVSKSGLICTSYHGLNFSSQVSVQWNRRSYTAETIFRSATADLALLALKGVDGSNGIKQLPISCDAPPASQNRHAAASLGYAGWGTFGTNKEPKMPRGELTIKYDYNEHQERFEIYRISGGKGHSGSPVIDLHRFRVLGYVQSSYSTT